MAAAHPLSGELFRVRTRDLLDGCSSESNGSYLDGLLIGAELSAIKAGQSILLAVGAAQHLSYKTAIEALGHTKHTRILAPEETALLSVRGHSRLLARLTH
jgi:2-keto-3-deoxy-galactonokinase